MSEMMAGDGETLIGNHSRQISWHGWVETEGLSDLVDISQTISSF